MNKLYFLLFSLLILQSCIIDEVIEQKQNVFDNIENTFNTKSVEDDEYSLNIGVKNEADGVSLIIFEYKFNEIEFIKSDLNIEYNDSVLLNDIKLSSNDVSFNNLIILNGRLFCDTYDIYNGLIYIPLHDKISKYNNFINLSLYDGCNWYDEEGNKILQSIKFDVTVDDWKDVNMDIDL